MEDHGLHHAAKNLRSREELEKRIARTKLASGQIDTFADSHSLHETTLSLYDKNVLP